MSSSGNATKVCFFFAEKFHKAILYLTLQTIGWVRYLNKHQIWMEIPETCTCLFEIFTLLSCAQREVIKAKRDLKCLFRQFCDPRFSFNFQISNSTFCREKTKSGHPKNASHKLISAIFDISDPLKIVAKIIKNLAWS